MIFRKVVCDEMIYNYFYYNVWEVMSTDNAIQLYSYCFQSFNKIRVGKLSEPLVSSMPDRWSFQVGDEKIIAKTNWSDYLLIKIVKLFQRDGS